MKRSMIIGTILLFIITISLLGIRNIATVNADLNKTLDEVSTSVKEQDYDRAEEIVTQLKTFWEKETQLLDTYLKHDGADKISENIVRISGLVSVHDDEEILVEIESMRYNLKHLYESELPSIGNVL